MPLLAKGTRRISCSFVDLEEIKLDLRLAAREQLRSLQPTGTAGCLAFPDRFQYDDRAEDLEQAQCLSEPNPPKDERSSIALDAPRTKK